MSLIAGGGLGVSVFLFAWGQGVHAFYIFEEGYKAIFDHIAGRL